MIFGLAVIIGGTAYLFLFSPLFKIRNISIQGLSSDQKAILLADVQRVMETKMLGVKLYQNIFLFNADKVGDEFIVDMPVIKSVQVKKNYLRGLEFNFLMRKPIGIWCFNDNCQYFDEDGKLLGKAPESSGFVYLTVKDNREEQTIDPQILKSILLVNRQLPTFNVHADSVLISKNSLAEFRVQTNNGYDLIFSFDSDISRQLEVLRIFLEDKIKNPIFAPQYIDLRIDGRVYYK